jgi:hypothetical protein
MPIPTSKEGLTALFKALGARAPEQWARSQVDEGIPQLLRFLFLRAAWEYIPSEGDAAWIESAIESAHAFPDQPYAGLGHALARCRSKGVVDEDLIEIARCLQAQMLFSVGYLIDGPACVPKSLEDVSWGLFQVGEDGRPVGEQISGLHESVLEFDPTGREMRPQSGG